LRCGLEVVFFAGVGAFLAGVGCLPEPFKAGLGAGFLFLPVSSSLHLRNKRPRPNLSNGLSATTLPLTIMVIAATTIKE
jgi:hypothetical protein